MEAVPKRSEVVDYFERVAACATPFWPSLKLCINIIHIVLPILQSPPQSHYYSHLYSFILVSIRQPISVREPLISLRASLLKSLFVSGDHLCPLTFDENKFIWGGRGGELSLYLPSSVFRTSSTWRFFLLLMKIMKILSKNDHSFISSKNGAWFKVILASESSNYPSSTIESCNVLLTSTLVASCKGHAILLEGATLATEANEMSCKPSNFFFSTSSIWWLDLLLKEKILAASAATFSHCTGCSTSCKFEHKWPNTPHLEHCLGSNCTQH